METRIASPMQVRTWAINTGKFPNIGRRGRLPRTVVSAYGRGHRTKYVEPRLRNEA